MSLAAMISARAEAVGLLPPAEVVAGCAAYLEILAKWNRKMNLTALPIDPPSTAAIDRLVIEALIAARHVLPSDRHLFDVGSGGGSPALPMKVAAPWVRLTMVESREKKAAFLREAARTLGLADVSVEAARVEELRLDATALVDVVSIRAVSVNDLILSALQHLPRPDKRIFWFRSSGDTESFPGFTEIERQPLPGRGELVILSLAT